MDPRRAGLVLLLLAIGLLATLGRGGVYPRDFEQWACCEGEGAMVLAARGPAVARYEPESDSTVALFQCSHAYCAFAVRLEGDQRDAVDRRTVLVRSAYRPTPRGTEPLEPPIVATSFQGEHAVASVTRERFELISPASGLALVGAGIVASIGGALLAWGLPTRRAAWGGAGAAAGSSLAPAVLRALPPDVIFPGQALIVALALVGVAIALLRKASPVGIALLSAAAALAAGSVLMEPFFVHPPTR